MDPISLTETARRLGVSGDKIKNRIHKRELKSRQISTAATETDIEIAYASSLQRVPLPEVQPPQPTPLSTPLPPCGTIAPTLQGVSVLNPTTIPASPTSTAPKSELASVAEQFTSIEATVRAALSAALVGTVTPPESSTKAKRPGRICSRHILPPYGV